MTATKADVVAKFKELHKKNYNQSGAYMISNVPDEITEQTFAGAAWREVYNRYASDRVNIRSTNAIVPFMGHKFKIRLDGPLIQEHRSEFETYFGFGGHCEGFSYDRIIATYAERFDDNIIKNNGIFN